MFAGIRGDIIDCPAAEKVLRPVFLFTPSTRVAMYAMLGKVKVGMGGGKAEGN
jgi:hypothetical protein